MSDGCLYARNRTACRSVMNGLLTKGLNTGLQYLITSMRDALDYAVTNPGQGQIPLRVCSDVLRIAALLGLT